MSPFLLGLLLALMQQPSPPPEPPSKDAPAPVVAPSDTTTEEEAKPAAAPEKRVELNLLGATDAAKGESKRNENVSFNLIDNNALRELNARLGTVATIVTEFRPELKYFGTEFGNAPTGLLHLEGLRVPSRAASLHGGLSYSHSNSILSARSFFQVGSVLPARENTYSVNLSSGIWKGGFLTVTGSQQKLRGNVNGNVLVPLASERTPLATDPALRSLIQRWLSAYPTQTPNRTDIDPRALNTNAPQSVSTDSATVRLDQSLGKHDQIAARHSYTGQQVLAFQLVAGQNPDTTTKSHSSRLTWNHLFANSSVLEVTEGFDRVHSLLVPEPNAVGPQVSIGTAWQSLGPNATIPIDRVTNRFRHAVLYRSKAGNHLWTVGTQIDRVQNNGLEASSERGNYYFRNDFGRDAITNFRLGIASRYSAGIGDGRRHFRSVDQQYFAGDVWKVTSNFTMSYGVRYTPVAGVVEKNRLSPIDFNCDCNNLAPQFGLAWKPAGFGVFRAAYGTHFGEIYPQTLQQLRWVPPNFLKVEVQAPATILDPLQGAYLGDGARHIAFSVPRDLQAPYSHQYGFTWQPFANSSWGLELGYSGSRTKKLFMMWFLNRAVATTDLPVTTATITARRPDPRHFEYREVHNSSNAYFDAAKVTLRLPSAHGITAEASYWFSKALDTGAAYTNMAAGDDARQGYSQTADSVSKDLKGPSAFDQSHALNVRFQYAAPTIAAAPRSLRSALRAWRVSGVFLAKTGLPFTVLTGSDSPGFGNVDGTNGDRPNVLDPSVLGRSVGNPDTSTTLLPRSAFGPILPGQSRGNVGFNAFRRGGIRNFNASLARSFALPGHDWRLNFRAESINFLNTPQFADPNPDWSSPAFGKITNTLNDGRSFVFHLQFQF